MFTAVYSGNLTEQANTYTISSSKNTAGKTISTLVPKTTATASEILAELSSYVLVDEFYKKKASLQEIFMEVLQP